LKVNGESLVASFESGYSAINREWSAGDTITIEMPMAIQRLKADPRIEADRGRIALRYGPLIYNVETADQPDIERRLAISELIPEWRSDLLQGVMTVKGKWADGSPMMAIPHYARQNRDSDGGAPVEPVPAVDYAGGAAARTNLPAANPPVRPGASMVWIKE
jgi:DUF1680 family protein